MQIYTVYIRPRKSNVTKLLRPINPIEKYGITEPIRPPTFARLTEEQLDILRRLYSVDYEFIVLPEQPKAESKPTKKTKQKQEKSESKQEKTDSDNTQQKNETQEESEIIL